MKHGIASKNAVEIDPLKAYFQFSFLVKFTKTFISNFSSQFVSRPHLGSRHILWEAL